MDRTEDFYRDLLGRPWHRHLLAPDEDGAFAGQHHTVHITPVVGHALIASKTHALVSAMASFAAPAFGQAAHMDSYKPWHTPTLTVDGGA